MKLGKWLHKIGKHVLDFWRDESGSYHDTRTDDAVPSEVLREAVDTHLVNGSKDRMIGWTNKMRDGLIDIDAWHTNITRELTSLHIAGGIAASGGLEEFDDNMRTVVAERLDVQFDYLEGMVEDVRDGQQDTGDGLDRRVKMYAEAGRGTYEDVQRESQEEPEDGDEEVWERRIRDFEADSCEDCIEYAAMGWQPLGTLPLIGDSQCMVRCRCRFIYHTGATPPG